MLHLIVGASFALAARDRLRADGPFAAPAFPLVAMFAGFLVVPTAIYFYAVHAAWSWCYWLPPRAVPVIAIVPLMVLHGLAVLAGWYLGYVVWRRSNERRVVVAVIAALGVVWLGVVIGLRHRLGVSGSFDEYAAGMARGLFDVGLGYALLTVLLLQLGAAVYVIVELVRDGARVRSR